QLKHLTPRLTSETAARGVFFLSCGLVKKLLIADQLHPYVTRLYTDHAHLGLLTGWAAAVGYSLQLYFDFSGYSDMAVGLAWLLGFRFPQNFNSPFKAVNISDFWRRWHMSLSSWFRDYLFIPLGGSQRGAKRTVLNLVVTMFLAGLWHGAAWTFVVWGLVHGLFLGSHAVLRRAGWTPSSTTVNRAITFLLVCSAFVIFRSPSLGVAADVFSSMVGLHGLDPTPRLHALLPIKLDLIAKLGQSPQILILGDSRGRQAQPSYIERLTGRTGFNAAVMGGTAPDAWVFTRDTADRFPGQKRGYIWFVSAGLAGDIPDPRTEADPRGQRYLQEVAPYLDNQPLKVDWPTHPFTGYRPDGSLPGKPWPPTAEHITAVKAQAAGIVARIRQNPPVSP